MILYASRFLLLIICRHHNIFSLIKIKKKTNIYIDICLTVNFESKLFHAFWNNLPPTEINFQFILILLDQILFELP